MILQFDMVVDLGILGYHTVLVTAEYFPGRPGRYSGPPEKCYEDETAELDIQRLELQVKSPGGVQVVDLVHMIDDELVEKVYEDAMYHAGEAAYQKDVSDAGLMYESLKDDGWYD